MGKRSGSHNNGTYVIKDGESQEDKAAVKSHYFSLFSNEDKFKVIEEAKKLIDTLSLLNDFPLIIKKLESDSELNSQQIYKLTRLSDAALNKWKEIPDMDIKAKSILKFCIGLNLPSNICDFLMDIKGANFRKDERDILNLIKTECYLEDLEIVKERLLNYGIKI